MNKCQNCIHWVGRGEATGSCRRHPPTICNAILEDAMRERPVLVNPAMTITEAVKEATHWPRTSASDGCSEWESPMGPGGC